MAEQRRGQVEDQRPEELERLGVDPAQAQEWLAAQELDSGDDSEPDPAAQPPLLIWPENRAAFMAFMKLQTQWRYRPDGGPDGLRYDALNVVIDRLRLPDGDRVFDQVIEMEHAALEAWDGSKQH